MFIPPHKTIELTPRYVFQSSSDRFWEKHKTKQDIMFKCYIYILYKQLRGIEPRVIIH